MKNRINWIDVCKGLLILFVIMVHIPNYARTYCGTLSYQLWLIDYILQFFIACFFMQTFFYLSGYTSNFNKPTKEYIISLCKTILIPKFIFTILWRIGDWTITGRHSLMTEMFGETYFFLIECYWFLDALFIIKLVQYYLCKYISNDKIHGLFWLFTLILNIYINNYIYKDALDPGHHLNIFHYRNAMGMGIFVWMGYYVNKHNIHSYIYPILGTIFIPLTIYPYFTGIYEPVQYSHSTCITLNQIYKYLIFSICGSCSIITISKLINKSSFLEYLGQNSLIIYCLHFPFLTYTMLLANKLGTVSDNNFAIPFFIYEFVSTLILCIISIKIINTNKFKWIIGKF